MNGTVQPRLDTQQLARLPAAVRRPAYRRERLDIGIVHLGIGAFHRAHQAEYTEDVLECEPGPWRIRGVSLRQPQVRDQLVPQDSLYTLVERSATGDRLRIVGALDGVLVAPENPAAVLQELERAATRIVSLTVTEKGYCHDPASGQLDATHPDIVHDLAHPTQPRSAPGFLVAGLRARRAAGLAPYTVLCCDNLPSNGEVVRSLVLRFAELLDPALARWIEAHGSFPATMVDRIVPATTPADLQSLAQQLGVVDLAMVKAEPFRQWVIEDRFCAGRPAWERAGAQLVSDVRPFEEAKLRLLNGSHSTIAYLGFLAGCAHVHDAMRLPGFQVLVAGLMQEMQSTLLPPEGVDLSAYRRDLIARFCNPALQHRCYQIAMDGSQKLPQRLLAGVRDNLRAGRGIEHASFGVAAWMRYVEGRDETGREIVVQDPLAGRLVATGSGASDDVRSRVRALLSVREIFSDDLRQSQRFEDALVGHLRHLRERGARSAVELFAARQHVGDWSSHP
jgi:fructuronate reductase